MSRLIQVGVHSSLLMLGLFLSFLVRAEFLPVDQAFQLQVNADKGAIAWVIEPGYYLYKERIALHQEDVAADYEWQSESVDKDDPNFGLVPVFHDYAELTVLGESGEYRVSYQGCAEAGLCYPPQSRIVKLQIASTDQAETDSTQTDALPVSEERGLLEALLSKNVWVMLLTFFVLGLGLSLTPCVLPMVPILGGIIAGQSDNLSSKKGVVLALSYVLGMSVTYSLAGVLVGLFGAKLNLQAAMQTPWILTIFATVFVVLALSMFGFYELQLPNRLRNKMDSVGSQFKGGQLLGVAAMGAVSALVVSPCVSAPLAGALLYISTTGDAWLGGMVLFVLSLGMGAPLLLMGFGGGRFIPKAGMWMQQVKAFFGVVLLGVAIALVSRFLAPLFSVGLWAILLVSYACFILPTQWRSGWTRLQLSLATLLMAYGFSLLVSVFAGAPDLYEPLGFLKAEEGNPNLRLSAEQAPLFHRVNTVDALQQQLSIAVTQGRPAVVDLYADWCTACKSLEKDVFQQAEVQGFRDNVMFVQLDITDNRLDQQENMQTMGLFGPPALVFFSAKGEVQTIQQGELTLAKMVTLLRQMK